MTPAERKALTFLAAVAVLGMGARAAGLGDPPAVDLPSSASDERAALGRQLAAVDSARRARHPRRGAGTAGGAAGEPRRARRHARPTPDAAAATTTLAPLPLTPFTPPSLAADTRPRARTPPVLPAGPIDADQADSAALDRLPGVGPALAHRIVADRQAHGPFGSIAGLSRVRGIGPRLEARLAPLVTFSAR